MADDKNLAAKMVQELTAKNRRYYPPHTQTIRVDSVLGGHSPTSNFASKDQFRASLGIDPSLPLTDAASLYYGGIATGLLRPAGVSSAATTTASYPLWFKGTRSSTNVFMYGADGSAYVVDVSPVTPTITALADGGSLSSSSGNGAAYYDNYMYFAKNTDIARYGPLDSSDAVFNGSYWTGTLGKAALTNTTYPTIAQSIGGQLTLPNHVLHRHSDGKLYIADVVGDQGTIHYIATTKTTTQGDTDNSSTASKLTFGYGLHPTALESYGSNLVIALFENDTKSASNTQFNRSQRAKLAFWDTTSANFNSMVWVEFPDPVITAMKNVDGVLYVVSGQARPSVGFRVSRFVGGYTFEEVAYSEFGSPCFPGAIDGTSKRLLFGTSTRSPESAGSVFSLSLQKSSVSRGIFNILRIANTTKSATSLLITGTQLGSMAFDGPLVGWVDLGASSSGGVDIAAQTYTAAAPSIWWSQMYRIGGRFKITKLKIPLATPLSATTSIVPTIYTDDGANSKVLTTISSANYTVGEQLIVMRLDALVAKNNFWLELKWSSTGLDVVSLPITIEFEALSDD